MGFIVGKPNAAPDMPPIYPRRSNSLLASLSGVDTYLLIRCGQHRPLFALRKHCTAHVVIVAGAVLLDRPVVIFGEVGSH